MQSWSLEQPQCVYIAPMFSREGEGYITDDLPPSFPPSSDSNSSHERLTTHHNQPLLYSTIETMSDDVRTTLESGGQHPHHDEHDPSNKDAQTANDGKPRTEWSSYMVNVYSGRKPPSIGSYDVGKLEERAREVTKGYHGSSIPFSIYGFSMSFAYVG